ncbi:MAG: C45 family autoproteolytic acyltransferase/hydrolase [Alphaproteobacteria bacterium]
MTTAPFPLIEMSGPPRERGRQYGSQAADRVGRSVDYYVVQLAASGVAWPRAKALAADYIPLIERFSPAYLDEMRGIAEGAGVDLEGIVIVNARTEMMFGANRQAEAETDDACTGAIVMPEASRDGRLLHGQNWDWREECVHTGVVLRIRREDGPDVLSFTEAGGLARSGLNAAGIAVTGNFLACDRDYKQQGVPLPLIRRRILEASHFALAIHTLAAVPRSCSSNMMLSDAAGEAINFECAPDELFCVYPEDDLITHANHFVHPAAQAKLRDTYHATSPDSLYRDRRVRKLLMEKRGALTLDDLRDALLDDYGMPYSVCRPPRAMPGGPVSVTAAMILMDAAVGLLQAVPAPYANHTVTEYRLKDKPAGLRKTG